MPEDASCAYVLCGKKFSPRLNGRGQRFCSQSCRRKQARLVERIGRKVFKVLITEGMQIFAEELKKHQKGGGGLGK